MKTYIKEHVRDAALIAFTFTAIVLLLSLITGCSSRLHTSHHYDADGNLVHRDRTRSYQLFGKSENAGLKGTYDYGSVVNGKTNLFHSVKFGVDSEKKGVDADGLKAGGGALGEVIGEAAGAVVKP